MTTDPEGLALLAGIKANPDDAARWGVASDWFRDRGDHATADVLATRGEPNRLEAVRVINETRGPVALWVLESPAPTLWMSGAVDRAEAREWTLPRCMFGIRTGIPLRLQLRHPDPTWPLRRVQSMADWVSCGEIALGGPWGWNWGLARFIPRRQVPCRLDSGLPVPGYFDTVSVEWRTGRLMQRGWW